MKRLIIFITIIACITIYTSVAIAGAGSAPVPPFKTYDSGNYTVTTYFDISNVSNQDVTFSFELYDRNGAISSNVLSDDGSCILNTDGSFTIEKNKICQFMTNTDSTWRTYHGTITWFSPNSPLKGLCVNGYTVHKDISQNTTLSIVVPVNAGQAF